MITLEQEIQQWFVGRLPDGWFTGAPEVLADREEILVVGTLPGSKGKKVTDEEREAAIAQFREDTREERMAIADDAQRLFRRKVSWGAESGGVRRLFTHVSMPVMTRLRIPERQVLDTLVAAGVARSRSHALAWCVKLVGEHQAEWLKDLQSSLEGVEKARAGGPAQPAGTV